MNKQNKVSTAKQIDIGGREDQQDSVDILTLGNVSLLIVADGMGGHEGGKLASSTIVNTGMYLFRSYSGKIENPKKFFRQVIDTGYEKIKRYGKQHGQSPHTTVAILLISKKHAYWAHVGDCRIIRFNSGKCVGRTKDHSVVELLFRQGEITETEMATHPDQNKLLRSIGGHSKPQITFGEADIKPGDAFLLCSDGLWENFSQKEMAKEIYSMPAQQAADYMVGLAKERAGADGDNISCALWVAPKMSVTPSTIQNRASLLINNKNFKLVSIAITISLLIGLIGGYFLYEMVPKKNGQRPDPTQTGSDSLKTVSDNNEAVTKKEKEKSISGTNGLKKKNGEDKTNNSKPVNEKQSKPKEQKQLSGKDKKSTKTKVKKEDGKSK